ncbi:MAG: DsbA family protein [Myxococcota bacterium]
MNWWSVASVSRAWVRWSRAAAFAAAFALFVALPACGYKPVAARPVDAAPIDLKKALPPAPVIVTSIRGTANGPSATAAKVPVAADDAQRGGPLASVIIVQFTDFECPFCSRVNPTLRQVMDSYGDRVRLVFKHNPLPFHSRARPAAEASRVVLALGGNDAFFKFHDLAFANQRKLTDENFLAWAIEAGVDGEAFKRSYTPGMKSARVDEDIQLAAKIGATGTPAFRINGVTVSGAQPFAKFKEVIDAQLEASRRAIEAGTPPEDVYTELTNKNQADPPKKSDLRNSDEEDESVWRIRVASDDPVRGPADALVTIVMFAEFQCPFCKRVLTTLDQVQREYTGNVRIVWKDNPLPFHPRARPAAAFARFVFNEKGNAGFWQAHDELFASQPKLEEEDFERIAHKLGVSWLRAKAALQDKRLLARLDESVELAGDFQARGTPHFFINGVRFSGAQSFEKFKEVIDERLSAARELEKRAVPRARIYEALIRDGKGPVAPEVKDVAAPQANAPFRGGAQAKVVIQEFSDFQCPFCARVQNTLRELEKDFGTQIKLVFRHHPLPFHKDAPLAAEAAEEARAQKGNAGFWAFHDALFAAQAAKQGGERDANALDREHLEAIAAKQGLDMARFRAALDGRVHEPRVRADDEAATAAGINGTPGFMINRYFLSGAQPKSAFERLIRKALAEANAKGR